MWYLERMAGVNAEHYAEQSLRYEEYKFRLPIGIFKFIRHAGSKSGIYYYYMRFTVRDEDKKAVMESQREFLPMEFDRLPSDIREHIFRQEAANMISDVTRRFAEKELEDGGAR
jgi:hypothetical protein